MLFVHQSPSQSSTLFIFTTIQCSCITVQTCTRSATVKMLNVVLQTTKRVTLILPRLFSRKKSHQNNAKENCTKLWRSIVSSIVLCHVWNSLLKHCNFNITNSNQNSRKKWSRRVRAGSTVWPFTFDPTTSFFKYQQQFKNQEKEKSTTNLQFCCHLIITNYNKIQ